jgi:regulator of nucleoside diphosphate kinase
MINRTIYITEQDRSRLRQLMANAKYAEYRGSKYFEALVGELERAVAVEPKSVPPDVITMNSRVQLADLESGETMVYTLVFPQDADLAQGKISVLAPIGTAMLGYRVGDVFSWQVPSGERRIKVEAILYQPEAAGDYDL